MAMKENWNKLDKPARIRLVILALIILWCTYSVIAYTYEIYHLDISQGMVDTKNMGPIWIDGSDFTPIFKALGSGTNGLVILAIYGIYTVAMMVMSVVPMLIYWLAAIRRAENIVWEEAELAKNICGLGGFLGLVIGIGVTGFSTKIPPVWFTLCWLLWAFLLVIIPMRKRLIPSAAPVTQQQNSNGGQM